jgi:hypothetical protein
VAGDYLAVGTQEGQIFLYSVSKGGPNGTLYTRAGVCNGSHSSAVLQVKYPPF